MGKRAVKHRALSLPYALPVSNLGHTDEHFHVRDSILETDNGPELSGTPAAGDGERSSTAPARGRQPRP